MGCIHSYHRHGNIPDSQQIAEHDKPEAGIFVHLVYHDYCVYISVSFDVYMVYVC